MNLQPLGDRVLIQPVAAPQTTTSGIIMTTDTAPLKKGKVVSISTTHNPVLAVGTTVLYEAGAGTPVEEGGVNYLLLKESNIACVLPNE